MANLIKFCVYISSLQYSTCNLKKKKIFINFTDFTDKRTSVLHTLNIVTNYPLEDNEEKETLTIGIATAMVIATVIVLTSLVAIAV